MSITPLVAVLQVGDTSSPTDSVDLSDATNTSLVGFDEGTLQEPPGPNPEDTQYAYTGRRTLKLDILVMDLAAQSWLTAQATIRAIEHKLTQANRAIGAGGQWIGTPVTLRMRLPGGSTYVYWDVVGGTLTQHWPEPRANPIIPCTLTLSVLPYAHGDLVTTSTLGMSSGYQYTQASLGGIPGDRSAICTLYWTDTSATGHTNRMRFGRRSFPNMSYQDYTGVADLKPDGGTDTADATAANGHYCRITATPNAQKIASAGIPDKFNSWETGDFTGMTGQGTVGVGSLSEVIAGAHYIGTYGYHAKAGAASGVGFAYYQIAHPTQATYADTWLNVRNSLTSGVGTYFTLKSSTLGTDIVLLQYSGGSWVLTTRKRDGTSTSTTLGTTIAASTWTKVRLVYDQLPSNEPQASCYISTDGRIWTLAAQYNDATAGTVYVPDQAILVSANVSGAILPETWYDQLQTGDWNPQRAQQHGKMNVWCRARTSAGSLQTPTSLAGAVTLGVGSLQAGTFNIVVTALDGSSNETAATSPIAVTLAATGEVVLTWTENGTASNHRVYVNDTLSGTSRWTWVATGSASATYTLASALPLANSGSPPSTSATALGTAYLRGDVAVAAPGGSPNYVLGKPQPFLVGNGNWETVFLGTYDTPPVPRAEQNAAGSNVFPDLPWTFTVQGLYGGTGSPTIDVDAIWMFPADEPSVSATYSALNLAANYQWEIDTRRDGRVSGILREETDLLPVGQLRVDGRFTLGVGLNVVMMLIEQGSGVNSWTNPSGTFYLTYRPRYAHITNAVT